MKLGCMSRAQIVEIQKEAHKSVKQTGKADCVLVQLLCEIILRMGIE